MKSIRLILLGISLPFLSLQTDAQKVVTYPAPQAVIHSMHNDDYTVRVRKPGGEWKDLFEYNIKVDAANETNHQVENATMCSFDFSGKVEVSVTDNKGLIRQARIRPLSYGIQSEIKGNTIHFTLNKPCNLSVEVNGDIFHNLHLFANPIEDFIPNKKDTSLIYFAAGVHQLEGGKLKVPSGKTVYLAGGAVLTGQLVIDSVHDVKVLGRGIITPSVKMGVRIAHSRNITVEGIFLTQCATGGSDSVTIRNVKSISYYGWGDGMNVFASNNVLFDGVFCRNSDDCTTVYGTRLGFVGGCKNITMQNSTLWADVAHPILIGTHGNSARPDTLENLNYVNIDILDHREVQVDYQGCLSINAGDNNLVRNVRFENIRVEDFRQGQLINLRVFYNKKYCTAPGRGIENVLFKDIVYNGKNAELSVISGYDENRKVKNVVFQNLVINGTLITDEMPGKPKWYKTADMARFFVGEHVEGVEFKSDFLPLQTKIQSWIDSGYYKGASIIIAKDNEIVYKNYFGSYKPETVEFIASASKWLAAATIAAIADEGKLNWNDKVKKWLPEFTGVKGEATLVQLLSHTAGYPDYQPREYPIDMFQTLKESVAHIVNLPADTLPGTKFKYGGLAMNVAGRMAELATGKDWETLFQQKIAIPVGMRATHFTPVDSVGGHAPMLGGGARTTLQDYVNFLSMIFNDGMYKGKRVLSASAIKTMQADHVGNARVKAGEFVEKTRSSLRKDIYGLGEWREEVNAQGEATLISSPSWAGAYPWIDKKNNIFGFFMTHVANVKNGFNSFLSSPVLAMDVRHILDKK